MPPHWALETSSRGSLSARILSDAMDSGPAQNRAVASIVQRWAQQDPAAAREWVDSFRDGPLKKNAFEHIFAQSAAKMTTEEETAD